MAITARSVAAVEDVADLVQVRVLVVIAERRAVSLNALADAAGLHISKASRVCDRMAGEGLIDRRDDPSDRRQLTLTLTPKGQRVVRTMMARRRAETERVLARMNARQRTALAAALNDFAKASGELAEERDPIVLGE
jgi:DNA-binding MarR family transcriptional regulator